MERFATAHNLKKKNNTLLLQVKFIFSRLLGTQSSKFLFFSVILLLVKERVTCGDKEIECLTNENWF